MKNEIQLLELLRQGEGASTGRSWQCLDENQIVELVAGDVGGLRRRYIERHLARCSNCLEQLSLALKGEELELPSTVPAALLAEARRFGQTPRNPARAAVDPRWQWVSAAAAVVAVVTVATIWLPRAPESISRGSADSVSETRVGTGAPLESPAPEILFPRDGASILAGEVEFRWSEVPGAIDYQVQLLSAAGDVVWQDRSERVKVRASAAGSLAPGLYYVWVRARLENGMTLRSPLVEFRMHPEELH